MYQAEFCCVDGDGTVPCESAMVSKAFLLYVLTVLAVCHLQSMCALVCLSSIGTGKASNSAN
jgi:hypothetical protein